MAAPALPGIFALAVLAHDDAVESAPTQGPLDAGQQAGGADVGVLIEGLADVEAQAPEGHVVGDIRVAHGTEIDGVEGAQRLQAVFGHHPPRGAVEVRAPVEGFAFEGETTLARRHRLQNLDSRRNHLLADSVARDHGDTIVRHACSFCSPAETAHPRSESTSPLSQSLSANSSVEATTKSHAPSAARSVVWFGP